MGSAGWLLSDTGCAGKGGGAGGEMERERGVCEGSLCVPICVCVFMAEDECEREVKKETTVISSVYSFMPPSSLWGIHEDVWLQI